jgi:exodeoxyribonuclease III
MKIVTWNVNSVRARLERLIGVLRRHEPDVLCLQETKTTDDRFPREVLSEAGYHAATFGQKTYNGTALLSRKPALDMTRGFDANPIPEQARVISATFDGIRVIDVYVVNGREVDHDQYHLKLEWLDRLTAWIDATSSPDQPLVITGDFNIAPDDRDVHDPERWQGKCLCTDAERERYQALLDWGLVDLHRQHSDEAGLYTWWDYRFGAFPRDMGLRIDLALGTKSVADRLVSVEVDREERHKSFAEGNPSDHAPVIVTLE